MNGYMYRLPTETSGHADASGMVISRMTPAKILAPPRADVMEIILSHFCWSLIIEFLRVDSPCKPNQLRSQVGVAADIISDVAPYNCDVAVGCNTITAKSVALRTAHQMARLTKVSARAMALGPHS